MQRKRSFVKLAGKKVQNVVREHYLRDDIACGFEKCMKCAGGELQPAQAFYVPDTNIFLSYIGALEHESVRNIILLQTALGETRNRNFAVYQRVRAFAEDKNKNAFVFSNELSSETYTETQGSESPNDRNDRLIRKAVGWYQKHIGEERGTVFYLVTNDKDNKRRAEEEGIQSLTFSEYAAHIGLEFSPEETEDKRDGEKFAYKTHLSLEKAKNMEKEHPDKYAEGVLRTFQTPFRGVVKTKSGEIDIAGAENINRALHGDRVIVAIQKTAGEDGTENITSQTVAVVAQKTKTVACIITQRPDGEALGNWLLATPTRSRLPRIRIHANDPETLLNKFFAVTIDDWPENTFYPNGHLVKVFGDADDKNTETEVILFENAINSSPFSQSVLDCLPKTPWEITPEMLAGREDLRGETLFSIDPPGCTDIDDALHAKKLPNGRYSVGVHIADVSAFVSTETPIDSEAQSRGTTVYLIDRRIDMLPELLGTNLCSLKPHQDRLAFSVMWEMDEDGEILSTRFAKTAIRSCAGLTYSQAQSRIDRLKENSPSDEIDASIKILERLSEKLREKRRRKGALFLSSLETHFELTKDKIPQECTVKQQEGANHLIEEFMLCANISVAEKIHCAFPEHALLRRHDSPDPTKFLPLNTALKKMGLEIDAKTPNGISASLEKINQKCDWNFAQAVNAVVTRAMMRAVYFPSGSLSHDAFYHTGIASEIYTHFTSPIRRYPDVIVHRLLLAAVTGETLPSGFPDQQKYEKLCDHLNDRKDAATEASRSSCAIHACLFFSKKPTVGVGYVIRLTEHGFVVIVPKYGVEGLVWEESYTHDKENGAVVDETGKEIASLLKMVQVKIEAEKTERHKKLHFTLLG
ncbi:MAG: mitotic control protein dis3 [Amphiamblys sp. WSBS2006]|nr:MAG: mitotic control protein dis3 [Amphiamblys sp. WSBS2006]